MLSWEYSEIWLLSRSNIQHIRLTVCKLPGFLGISFQLCRFSAVFNIVSLILLELLSNYILIKLWQEINCPEIVEQNVPALASIRNLWNGISGCLTTTLFSSKNCSVENETRKLLFCPLILEYCEIIFWYSCGEKQMVTEHLTLSYLGGGGGRIPPSCFSSTILKRLKLWSWNLMTLKIHV